MSIVHAQFNQNVKLNVLTPEHQPRPDFLRRSEVNRQPSRLLHQDRGPRSVTKTLDCDIFDQAPQAGSCISKIANSTRHTTLLLPSSPFPLSRLFRRRLHKSAEPALLHSISVYTLPFQGPPSGPLCTMAHPWLMSDLVSGRSLNIAYPCIHCRWVSSDRCRCYQVGGIICTLLGALSSTIDEPLPRKV